MIAFLIVVGYVTPARLCCKRVQWTEFHIKLVEELQECFLVTKCLIYGITRACTCPSLVSKSYGNFV